MIASMSKFIYREARLSDVPQLVELRVLMQCEVNSFEISEVSPNFTSLSEKYFTKALMDQSYFSAVAELNGRLVSANGLVIYEKPPSINGLSGRVGYVTNVYTFPEYRGKGIAGELMQMLVQFAKKSNVAKLHLGATSSGKRVYERVGFNAVKFEALELKI